MYMLCIFSVPVLPIGRNKLMTMTMMMMIIIIMAVVIIVIIVISLKSFNGFSCHLEKAPIL